LRREKRRGNIDVMRNDLQGIKIFLFLTTGRWPLRLVHSNLIANDTIIMTIGPPVRWSPRCRTTMLTMSYRDSCRSPLGVCFQQSPTNVAYSYKPHRQAAQVCPIDGRKPVQIERKVKILTKKYRMFSVIEYYIEHLLFYCYEKIPEKSCSFQREKYYKQKIFLKVIFLRFQDFIAIF